MGTLRGFPNPPAMSSARPSRAALDATTALDFVEPARPIALELVGGRGHYERVVRAVMNARRSVWIATANLKELMVEDDRAAPGRRRTIRTASSRAPAYRSVLDVLDELAARAVELRILHAARPSGPFRAALAVDGSFVYLGSANWTGAGLGAKGTGRRNFELGFAGGDDALLDRVQELYDRVWRGAACKGCRLRDICPAPLDGKR